MTTLAQSASGDPLGGNSRAFGTATSDPDEDAVAVGHIDRRKVGALAHALIEGLLADGERQPDPVRISAAAALLPGLAQAGPYRMAVRQRIVTAAAIYFRLFAPDGRWVLSGAELRGPGARFDLVWRSTVGVVVDELKSGRAATRRELAALQDQSAREIRAGTDLFGEEFLGVRVVILGAPRDSYLASPDGRVAPLVWGSR